MAANLRARSPDPAQLSSQREPDAQPNRPSGSSGQKVKGRGSCRLRPALGLQPMPAGHRGASRPGLGLGEGPGALKDTAPSLSPRPLAGPRPTELEGPREKTRQDAADLTLQLRATPPPTAGSMTR